MDLLAICGGFEIKRKSFALLAYLLQTVHTGSVTPQTGYFHANLIGGERIRIGHVLNGPNKHGSVSGYCFGGPWRLLILMNTLEKGVV